MNEVATRQGMQELIERIRTEGVHVGGGIVKVDGFINHQVDSRLMGRLGDALAEQFRCLGISGISKVLTAEVSGILPALATAQAQGVPLVYARKQLSAAMTDDYFSAAALSRTRGNEVNFFLSRRYLDDSDSVLLIDDFLATGSTLDALVAIVRQSGARLCGIGCLIEKPGENGRFRFERLGVPIISLAKILFINDELQVTG